ncbi:MAG TPA: low temperature requirement protein A [Stellaceae bacterium]|nr:low temperature requirement protein A [Stellaceae bacterium]
MLRAQHSARVTYIELFFDLVFVFAVTQLSHGLLHHLDVPGAARTLFLFMAVWWVWIYTSWVTNWLDPERTPVRLAILALTLAGLLLATAIPDAFGDHAWLFAGTYVAMQLGRSLFMLWALASEAPRHRRNFQRITLWLAVSGALWLLGAALPELRAPGWIAALIIEYLGPSQGFFVPGLGRSATQDWDVEGGHMAERCALFVIIALGESLVDMGEAFIDLPSSLTAYQGLGAGFLASIAMWWLYFDTGAERGSQIIAKSEDPGRLARLAYTYLHLPIIAGIIVDAVADALALDHPAEAVGNAMVATMLGGPAIYVLGLICFKMVMQRRRLPPFSHLGCLAMLALLLVFGRSLSVLALACWVSLVLMLTALWETLSLRQAEL